jgi:hypothetical protein
MAKLIRSNKNRWFTSFSFLLVALGTTFFALPNRSGQVVAAPGPNFPTYTNGSFTFSTPLEMLRPLSPAFFQQGGEPEIKLDIFGNIYITGIQGVPGGVDLWKSINGGTSFVYMGQPDGAQDHCPTLPQCAGLGGGDDSIDVSNGGYLYVSSLWLGNVTVSSSYDGGTGGVLPGQKWEVNGAAAGVPGDDRQWVAAYGPQTLNMTYAANTGIAPELGLFFVKSTDEGKTWGPPVAITTLGATNAVNVEGNLVVVQYTGNLYTASIPSTGNNILNIARSTDGGATWSTPTAYTGPAGTTNRGVFPILAVDRGGNLHLAFTRSDDNANHTNCHVFLTSTANPAAATPTWTSPVQIDNNGAATGTACEAWIVAGSPGVVDVTWFGSTSNSPLVAPFNWHVYFAQVTNAVTASPTIAGNQVETAVVHDHSICFNGGGCASNGTPGGEPENRDEAEYYTMTIDASGNSHIAYADTVNNCPSSTCVSNTWFTKQTTGPSAYSPPAPPAPATFAANLTVTGSSGAAEPSIAVDSHNCIYGSAPGTYFWASENQGMSFRNTTVPPVLGGGDEDVATIPKQTGARNDDLYYADLAIADIDIFLSTDRGNTWAAPGTGGVAGNFNPSSDRQWIAGDRINSGANKILWELDHEFTTEQIRISASIDDSPWGTTSGEVDPDTSNSTENTNPGNVFVDKSTHTMHGVFAGSTFSSNAADPPYGKEPNYWEVVATPPMTGGLPPANIANYPIFRGLIDSPTTAPAGTTTYGSHVAAIFPSGAADSAGNIYAVWTTLSGRPNATIGGNPATTWDIWFASSHDGGKTFYGPFKISSGQGTAIFPWIDAGDAGRVDIVWYQANNPAPPLVSDPTTPGQLTGGPNNMPAGSTWTVVFAQSLNANSREPVFAVTTASDHIIHTGSISIGGLTGSSDRSLLDYFKIALGPDGLANIMNADNGVAGLHINYIRQNGGPLTLTNPVAATCLPIPVLNAVVSRKTHVGLTPPGDLPLALTGTPTIECRSGGIPSGNHTLVFTFANTLTSVTGNTTTATTSSGTQSVTCSGSITAANQYTLNCTGVPNASHLNVTLNGVTDNVPSTGNVSVKMDVLFGDVNSTARTDAGDVTQVRNRTVSIPDTTNPASFRYDVNISGRIDAGDVTATRNATVTVLPP